MDRNIRHQQQMLSNAGVAKRQQPPPPPSSTSSMNQQQQQQQQQQQHQRNDVSAQHDELIKFIHEAWHKVSSEQGPGAATYYKNPPEHRLHGFQPFDLENWWGRRLMHNIHITRGNQ